MREVLKKFKKLQPAPVAIFGAGLSGQGVKNLLDRMEWEYQIFDEQGRAFELKDARNCSVIVTSQVFILNTLGTSLQKRKERRFLESSSLVHCF